MRFTTLSDIKTPGVYVNEISTFPPSVAQVPTAIPVFIGYTALAADDDQSSLVLKTKKISSLLDYETYYGTGSAVTFTKIELDTNNQVITANSAQTFFLYDSLKLFFSNGGGDCYIISVKTGYTTTPLLAEMTDGLNVAAETDEPTMIVFPDAVSLTGDDLYTLQQSALTQSADLMDRVTIMDIPKADTATTHANAVQNFRNKIGMSNLKYGAAYTPWLLANITKDVSFRDIYNKTTKLSVPVDFATFTTDAAVATLIADLKQVILDNNTFTARINNYLTNITDYKPDGFADPDFKSIADGYKALLQSFSNKVLLAKSTLNPANVTAVQTEFRKMFIQAYELLKILDDLATGTTIGNADVKTLITNRITALDPQIIQLANWDATTASATKPPTGAFTSVNSGYTFTVVDNTSGTATNIRIDGVTLMYAPLQPAAAADIDRLNNIINAEPDITTIFNNIAGSITQLLSSFVSTEETKDASLLSQLPVYKSVVDALNKSLTVLPPSGTIAGIYARVDNTRGVWKAPANESLNYVNGLLYNISDNGQKDVNVDVNSGKSINAIRAFAGQGIMVWGARTLAGNDNEWRYISVRRFFNMVEESVKKSTQWAVFEPNDANTWVKVKGMIDNFLTLQWREGALAGAKPDEAFYCRIGLNQTMTAIDILEGRMNVEIGMAVVRPAEFIILNFSHKLQTS